MKRLLPSRLHALNAVVIIIITIVTIHSHTFAESRRAEKKINKTAQNECGKSERGNTNEIYVHVRKAET